MKKLLLLFILFQLNVAFADAQENLADTVLVSDQTEKEYRIQPDSSTAPFDAVSLLLSGKDHVKKVDFINGIQVQKKGGKSYFSADWKLDSIVFTTLNEESGVIENSQLQLFQTLEDNEMLVRNYNWDSEENHWIIDEGQYYSFSENGQLDSVEFREHVTINYILYTKKYYTYENGRLSTEVSKEKFDEFEDWKWLDRYTYEYDSIGRLYRVNTQELDKFSGNYWTTYEYLEYEYDSLGNLAAETTWDYDDYEKISTKKYELKYFYDEQNRLTTLIEYVKSWQPGLFVAERRQENEYDSQGRLVLETYYNWDYDLDNWLEDTQKSISFWNSLPMLQTVEIQEWQEGWVNKWKADYLAEKGIEKDNIESSEFIFSFLPVFELDGTVCDLIENSQWSNMNWEESGTTTYHFSPNWPVGVAPDIETSIKIYPNPVADRLVIDSGNLNESTCYIRDLSGRVLINKNITGKSTVDVASLAPGLYLIELRRANQLIFSDKIIKK